LKLREGTNDMICRGEQSDDEKQFHVACYHKAARAFMARQSRGFARAGCKGEQVDTVRFKGDQSSKLASATERRRRCIR
jgi:hypothetical protein